MNISCDVIKDLLPLYHDGVCNQSTTKLVIGHLNECESCRVYLAKISSTTIDNQIKTERQDVIAHQAKALRMRYIQSIGASIFSALILLGMLTCAIVDIAISGTLSWSLIPISGCILAGVVFLPTIKYGVKGITVSMVIFSICVMPFLFVLSLLIDSNELLLPIGIRVSVVSTVGLWCICAIFRIMKARKLAATAISLLLSIPISLIINAILSDFTHQPLIDIWDAMAFSIIIVLVFILFGIDYTMQKRKALRVNSRT